MTIKPGVESTCKITLGYNHYMKFSEDNPDAGFFISHYDNNELLINGKRFTQSLVISPDQLIENWCSSEIKDLSAGHFEQILALEPELIILGTGDKLTFPDMSVYAACINKNIGVEIMDTGAACRTYNVLLSENRKVVAGLLL